MTKLTKQSVPLKKSATPSLGARQIKDVLYEQVARIGKAASSPKRLELLELLCQGEMNVEQLAAEAQISIKLTSAHLSVLKASSLVAFRREGKNIFYSLAAPDVARFWVGIRSLAEERLLDLQAALGNLVDGSGSLASMDRAALLREAESGEVVVIDVRPEAEFVAGHLPFARSIPVAELKKRIAEIPKNKKIVAYCRGPFCLFASEAVSILQEAGHHAMRLDDGVAEWQARGLAIQR
ncbi:MAG: ArsR family transcriptional regulator [Gallionellales bacterium 35-53-114]|jgi:rhodanese-related sulfurtransferase|nr:MAG: ArsR family transcriptional regulator [Gallionellales bacterium 35-53-114]OYZ62690.1 MAG: ArsR family transcriptional regulator [Gallionellales bacterium 24-53-125]OZB09765.1 MAG: ArsR family transcriptional regulator [Gallionellales bacterium 39-52-133]HQS57672.1 metalloregulator ArsR/SmtB family transcription factor [Gallionellaceae bacterium]HQS74126.1 metalloregulator ArsR/SmtB family transcription factor [Gallionellaceae bacterium]